MFAPKIGYSTNNQLFMLNYLNLEINCRQYFSYDKIINDKTSTCESDILRMRQILLI